MRLPVAFWFVIRLEEFLNAIPVLFVELWCTFHLIVVHCAWIKSVKFFGVVVIFVYTVMTGNYSNLVQSIKQSIDRSYGESSNRNFDYSSSWHLSIPFLICRLTQEQSTKRIWWRDNTTPFYVNWKKNPNSWPWRKRRPPVSAKPVWTPLSWKTCSWATSLARKTASPTFYAWWCQR